MEENTRVKTASEGSEEKPSFEELHTIASSILNQAKAAVDAVYTEICSDCPFCASCSTKPPVCPIYKNGKEQEAQEIFYNDKENFRKAVFLMYMHLPHDEKRGYAGFSVVDRREGEFQVDGKESPEGLYVTQPLKGCPLNENDRLVEIDGKSVTDPIDAYISIIHKKPGEVYSVLRAPMGCGDPQLVECRMLTRGEVIVHILYRIPLYQMIQKGSDMVSKLAEGMEMEKKEKEQAQTEEQEKAVRQMMAMIRPEPVNEKSCGKAQETIAPGK